MECEIYKGYSFYYQTQEDIITIHSPNIYVEATLNRSTKSIENIQPTFDNPEVTNEHEESKIFIEFITELAKKIKWD
jgi:hypothetical protein